jgi:hypothetical protein
MHASPHRRPRLGSGDEHVARIIAQIAVAIQVNGLGVEVLLSESMHGENWP